MNPCGILITLVLCTTSGSDAKLLMPSPPGPRCKEFASLNVTRAPTEDFVSVYGKTRDVAVYWSAGPSRAAAALLLVTLRHRLRYRRLHFVQGPPDLCNLTREVRTNTEVDNDGVGLAVVLTAAWDPRKKCSEWGSCYPPTDGFCGLGGPSLVAMDAAAAPVRVRMYVYLSTQARRRPDCISATSWIFYNNDTGLNLCSFISPKYHPGHVITYVAEAENRALVHSILPATFPVRVENVSRAKLTDLVRTHNRSFLFLDWDMWRHVPGVEPMGAGPYVCQSSCDCDSATVGVRAVSELLFKYAPPLFQLTQQLRPEPEQLREVLELEANRTDHDVEEAACDWAKKHPAQLKKWLAGTDRFDHSMLAIVCNEDPLVGLNVYLNVTKSINNELWEISKMSGFGVNIYLENVTCSNKEEAGNVLKQFTDSTESFRSIGVVTGRENAVPLKKAADVAHTPLVVYDISTEGPHTAVGHLEDLAAALIQFFHSYKWDRVGILSDSTSTARALKELLDTKLCVHNVEVTDTEAALTDLESRGARVILLNMDSDAAEKVLEAATRRGMKPAGGYAWVTREWEGAPLRDGMRVFSVSFGCHQGREGANQALRRQFDELLPHRWWPRTASYVDALLTLVHGFVVLLRDHPQYKNDRHVDEALRLFWKGLEKVNVSGVCQPLRYKGTALAEPLVFIVEWFENEYERVAQWSMRNGEPVDLINYRKAYVGVSPPLDGSSKCIIKSGNCFTPTCHDVQWALGGVALLLTLALVPVVVRQARRAYRLRLDKIKSEIGRTWLSHREHTSQALARFLVPRSQLELREELGAGRAGRVRLAILRAPGHPPRAVAAKSLRHDAAPSEEGEFLREACTLSSLDHEHVVRLVGVCIGDPLFVLMEHAFFGDLLGYLRARWHLAEGADCEASQEGSGVGSEEATHVAAEALTRLVREAAAALAYLAHRGLVHRDVRAANCLVDSRRSLKLGDFGMARETSDAGADGAAEYACRRRGMFPVLWMAPESLERGAFSAASDVWALGVLMFEVVTLGARPYGTWSPLRVLQFVNAGGRPRLPLDATAQTRGVVHACWSRAARDRPTAPELVAYLAEHPLALRPALALDYNEPDVDSGYGEPDAADSPDSFDRPSPDSVTAFFPN